MNAAIAGIPGAGLAPCGSRYHRHPVMASPSFPAAVNGTGAAMNRPAVTASTLEALRRMAVRYAGSPDDADDLVQDVLLAALEQGRAWDDAGSLAWARGVLRRRAAFIARTEGRRRRREASYATEAVVATSPETTRKLPHDFIDTLPPALRTVALLANIGLGRAEITRLLGITDAAMRQRITKLRRAWRSFGGAPEVSELPRGFPASAPRRSLAAGLAKLPYGRFAFQDPDGHPVYVAAGHKSAARGNQ